MTASAPTITRPRPREEDFRVALPERHRTARILLTLFQAATIVSVLALAALLASIVNQSFGPVLVQNTVDPATLAVDGVPLEEQSAAQLAGLLRAHLSAGVLRRLEAEQPLDQRSREDLSGIVVERVVAPRVLTSWYLSDALLSRQEIAREQARHPGATVSFRAWLNPRFLAGSQSSVPENAGVRTAILGSLWVVAITIVVAFPVGVAAAIYLEEYAGDSLAQRIIQTNINNLAGVPSIVYGVFGLGFFVYGIGGSIDAFFYPERLPTPTFGTGGILWASLTLALLTVPVVIVSTEEGLAAVPKGLREGSLSLGATKLQTLLKVVLPMATPGIMTGMILAMARAAGEVAPLMLVGVVKLAPSLPIDGTFPFFHMDRKFMHLGFHIYDVGFQSPNVEAAKPMVFVTTLLLLAIVITASSAAIVIRNRMKQKYATKAF